MRYYIDAIYSVTLWRRAIWLPYPLCDSCYTAISIDTINTKHQQHLLRFLIFLLNKWTVVFKTTPLTFMIRLSYDLCLQSVCTTRPHSKRTPYRLAVWCIYLSAYVNTDCHTQPCSCADVDNRSEFICLCELEPQAQQVHMLMWAGILLTVATSSYVYVILNVSLLSTCLRG